MARQLVRGDKLSPEMQRQALARFVHRFTRDHVPDWTKKPRENGKPHKVQFRSDAEWLAHTIFEVDSRGELTERSAYYSNPTWPEGDR